MQGTVWLTIAHAGHAATQPRARRPLAAADAALAALACFCFSARQIDLQPCLVSSSPSPSWPWSPSPEWTRARTATTTRPSPVSQPARGATRPTAPYSAPLGHAL